MNDLTLIIPAKNESDSLPQVLDSLKNLTCKIKVSLKVNDKTTINSIKNKNIANIFKFHNCLNILIIFKFHFGKFIANII